jgi:DNA-binding XRE family transcriptional regulator
MQQYIIYGLYCPFTDNIHYIGKSTVGMLRPLSHMTKSHSTKINEWVSQLKVLGYKPIIKILEECTIDNIDELELYWIDKTSKDGAYLLNSTHNSATWILGKGNYVFEYSDIKTIGQEIRRIRKMFNISQETIATICEIDRSTLVRIENGDKQVCIKNIHRVLHVLGLELITRKINKDE